MNHALRQRRRMGGLLFDCIAARSSNRQLCCNERPARFVQDLSLRDHSLGNPALPTDMNSLDQSTICLDILQQTSNQHHQQPTTITSLAHRTEHEARHQSIAIDSNPIARPTPLTRPKFCREKSRIFRPSPHNIQPSSTSPSPPSHQPIQPLPG